MPRLPGRACAHPGCTKLVRGRRRRFCNDHQSEEWKRQDRDRGTASERGYGDEWTAIRDAFLAEHRGVPDADPEPRSAIISFQRGMGAATTRITCSPCAARATRRNTERSQVIDHGR